MKHYNDVVTYVRNGKELPAFVIDSREVNGEEQLRLAYLDPEDGLQKVNHDGTISRAYAVLPLKPGATNGWKDALDVRAVAFTPANPESSEDLEAAKAASVMHEAAMAAQNVRDAEKQSEAEASPEVTAEP